MNDSKVAFIPKKTNGYLTEYGVISMGGMIVETGLSESDAEARAFRLSNDSGKHYIPIH